MAHIVCTIRAYDILDQIHWCVTCTDIDLPPDDPTRFYYMVGSLDGQGIEDLHTWVRDVCVDVIETV
jgi:hypothetical protein